MSAHRWSHWRVPRRWASDYAAMILRTVDVIAWSVERAGTCIRPFAQVAWAAGHVLVVGWATGAAIAAHAVAAHGWLVVVWPMVGAAVATVVGNRAIYVAHLAGGVA